MILTSVGQSLLHLFVILYSDSTPGSRSWQITLWNNKQGGCRTLAPNEARGTARGEAQKRARRDPQEDGGGGCKAVAEREADRAIKRERARRAKEAGPEAIRNGKYPRCTQ